MGSKAHLTVTERRRYYHDICLSFVTQLKATLSGKGRKSSSKKAASAAARLHEACAEFMDNIRAGSLGTIKTIVEGANVLVTSAKGDVRGEVVHLDRDFACVDYVDEMDDNIDILFDVRGLKAQQQLEEDEVWSDGNKVFIARKNSVFDALRQIPLDMIRTDPSWLKDKIAENRTDDLACFLNVSNIIVMFALSFEILHEFMYSLAILCRLIFSKTSWMALSRTIGNRIATIYWMKLVKSCCQQ
jgi:hypothetical protein